MLGVLLREDGLFYRYPPINTQAVVLNGYAAVGFGRIEIVALILEHRRLTQNREAVGKTTGDEELAVIVLRKLNCDMLPVSRRAFPNIHRNVQHSTLDASHQLGLSEGRTLKMQSSHHAVRRHRFIVLHEMNGAHLLKEFALGKTLKEIPSGVLEHTGFNDEHALDSGFYNFH